MVDNLFCVVTVDFKVAVDYRVFLLKAQFLGKKFRFVMALNFRGGSNSIPRAQLACDRGLSSFLSRRSQGD
jgi:hypothetical protein